MTQPLFRLYMSIPGDVQPERELAANIVQRIAAEYATRCEVTAFFREHEPSLVEAGSGEIPAPSTFDAVICILWSRLGFQIPQGKSRPDGTAYSSGTDFEFEDAATAALARGTPELLVYFSKREVAFPAQPKEEREKQIARYEALQDFFQRWFTDTRDGTLQAAFNTYQHLSQFEELLGTHLRRILEKRFPQTNGRKVLPAQTWKRGSPFRGLASFEFEDAPIFFGRTQAIEDILAGIRSQLTNGRCFTLVFGNSGGGKSSLLRAGLIPFISRPGVIEGFGLWRRALMKPSEAGGNLFQALADALVRRDALPELVSDGTQAEALAGMLRSKPGATAMLVKGGLSQAAEALARSNGLSRQPLAGLIIGIDQMEEIFSHVGIEANDRQSFFQAMEALAQSGRVVILATLRSEFFQRCCEIPRLMSLKEGNGQYHLENPNPAEVGQMIRLPASAAGLRFEETSNGERLDDFLRDEAIRHPGSLPLLEFLLEELYQRRTPESLLTFAAFRETGGFGGALKTRAEEVFERLPPPVRATLPQVFRQLARPGDGEQAGFLRRQVLREEVAAGEAKPLVEALISARLLVSEAGDDGKPLVGVAHEALFTHWPAVREILDRDRKRLQLATRIERAAMQWRTSGCENGLLMVADADFKEAMNLLLCRDFRLGSASRQYILLSDLRQNMIGLYLLGMVTMALLQLIWELGQKEPSISVLIPMIFLFVVNFFSSRALQIIFLIGALFNAMWLSFFGGPNFIWMFFILYCLDGLSYFVGAREMPWGFHRLAEKQPTLFSVLSSLLRNPLYFFGYLVILEASFFACYDSPLRHLFLFLIFSWNACWFLFKERMKSLAERVFLFRIPLLQRHIFFQEAASIQDFLPNHVGPEKQKRQSGMHRNLAWIFSAIVILIWVFSWQNGYSEFSSNMENWFGASPDPLPNVIIRAFGNDIRILRRCYFSMTGQKEQPKTDHQREFHNLLLAGHLRQAVEMASREAAEGYAWALYEKGLGIQRGLLADPSTTPAACFERAVNGGEGRARVPLANCFLDGREGVQRDRPRAQALLRIAAAEDDIDAQLQLLDLSGLASDSAVPPVEAIQWGILAESHPLATSDDRNQAREHLQHLQQQLEPTEFQQVVGEAGRRRKSLVLQRAESGEERYVVAANWVKAREMLSDEAALNADKQRDVCDELVLPAMVGDTQAMVTLASILQNLPADDSHQRESHLMDALTWYSVAASQNGASAPRNLASLSRELGDGCREIASWNAEELSESIRLARATFALSTGRRLYDPLAPESMRRAASFLTLAVDLDSDEARVLLARMFFEGSGVHEDKSRAQDLLRTAASNGNANAQAELARVLLFSPGEAEQTEGATWLHHSTSFGACATETPSWGLFAKLPVNIRCEAERRAAASLPVLLETASRRLERSLPTLLYSIPFMKRTFPHFNAENVAEYYGDWLKFRCQRAVLEGRLPDAGRLAFKVYCLTRMDSPEEIAWALLSAELLHQAGRGSISNSFSARYLKRIGKWWDSRNEYRPAEVALYQRLRHVAGKK